MDELYQNGMSGIQLATVERLRENLQQVLDKTPNNRDALTQLSLLLYGYTTQPLAQQKQENVRWTLMTSLKLKQPQEGPGLVQTLDVLRRGLDAGLQDSRVFRAYGLASWQQCLAGEALSIASEIPGTSHEENHSSLLQAYTYLGRVSNLEENARNPLFLTTFARVCEASGDIERALILLGDMVTSFEQWELLPHAVLYASNLCFHPDFNSELFLRGIQYAEWVAEGEIKESKGEMKDEKNGGGGGGGASSNPSHLPSGWMIWELIFCVARCYQIAGRGDLAAPKFRHALQLKNNLATTAMVTDEMLVIWLSDSQCWKHMGQMYKGAGLNLYAADALAQSIHLTKGVHSVEDWLPLADVLRLAGTCFLNDWLLWCYFGYWFHQIFHVLIHHGLLFLFFFSLLFFSFIFFFYFSLFFFFSGAHDASIHATAHAYEINRCHDSTRRRLQSWSPEWREMFQLESRVVTLIQSWFRRHLACLAVEKQKQLWKEKNWHVLSIQIWFQYYHGLKIRRRKRTRAAALLLKIKNRYVVFLFLT